MNEPSQDAPSNNNSYRRTLGQTFSEEEFTADAVVRKMATPEAQNPTTHDINQKVYEPPADVLQGINVKNDSLPRISKNSLQSSVIHEERYDIKQRLGLGANGIVFAGLDRSLGREIAVKFLRAERASDPAKVTQFIHEGQIAASLEHPGILPIYDIDRADDGRPYLTMRRFAGDSLESFMGKAVSGNIPPEIATFNSRINIVLKLCEALAAAHSKGVVHRDIKPANVMLGRFGEVVLIDWGTAASSGELLRENQRLVGTPLFMSPEQARRERADERSDIYSVGVVLFYLLTLRVPLWADDPAEFWRRKRLGEIDPLKPDERKLVPAPLLAIALKALEPDPDRRYGKIHDVAADLSGYQAGQAVSAYPDSLLAFASRWYRRNKSLVWVACLAGVCVLGAGLMLYREQIKEIASWGKPVEEVDFTNNTWHEHWGLMDARAHDESGESIAADDGTFAIAFKKPLSDSVAVEFDAEPLPAGGAGRMYVQWYEKGEWSDDQQNLAHGTLSYGFLLGSQFSAIQREQEFLDYKDYPLQMGKPYHVRVELEQYEFSLYIDGERVCYASEETPRKPGVLVLRRIYAGRIFKNLRLYSKGIAEKVSAIYVADAFASDGYFDRAMNRYDEIVRSHPGTPLAYQAIFRKGLCLRQQGKKSDALMAWEPLMGTAWQAQVDKFKRDDDFSAGRHKNVLMDFRQRFPTSDISERKQLIIQWQQMADQLVLKNTDKDILLEYLRVWSDLFPQEKVCHGTAAEILDRFGRYDEILTQCPGAVTRRALTLVRLHREEEMLKTYPDYIALSCDVLRDLGRYQELIQRYSTRTVDCAHAMIQAGQAEDALKTYGKNQAIKIDSLIALGREQEVIDEWRTTGFPGKYREQFAWALLQARKYEEVLAAHVGSQRQQELAMLMLGRRDRLFKSNQATPFMQYAKQFDTFLQGGQEPPVFADTDLWIGAEQIYSEVPWAQYLLVPLARYIRGDKNAMSGVMDQITKERRTYSGGTLWNIGMFVTGRMSEQEFQKQPDKQNLVGNMILAQALKADFEARRHDGLQLYQQYRDLPFYKKGFKFAIHQFVLWRIDMIPKK